MNSRLDLHKTIARYGSLPPCAITTETGEQFAAWLSSNFAVHNITPNVFYDRDTGTKRSLLQTFTDGSYSAKSDICAVTAIDTAVLGCNCSRMGPTPASCPEVEITSLSEGFRQHCAVRRMLQGIGLYSFAPTKTAEIIGNDNAAALSITHSGGLTRKSRCIQGSCLHLKSQIRAHSKTNQNLLTKVAGLTNPANLDTKLLGGKQLVQEGFLLGMVPVKVTKPINTLQQAHDNVKENFHVIREAALKRGPTPSNFEVQLRKCFTDYPI